MRRGRVKSNTGYDKGLTRPIDPQQTESYCLCLGIVKKDLKRGTKNE